MTRASSICSSRRQKRETASVPNVPTGTGPVPAAVIVTSAGPNGPGAAQFAWLRPTTKYDGSTLTSGEISHYLLREYDVTTGALVGSPLNVGNVLTYNRTGLGAGSHDFTLACVSAYGEGPESLQYRVAVS